MITKPLCCPVCGDGVPLSGPTADDTWQVCRACHAEGYTGLPGDDIRRHIGQGPATTADGLTVYDLDPQASELWVIAGPPGLDVLTIDTDNLPDGCRWITDDEWAAILAR